MPENLQTLHIAANKHKYILDKPIDYTKIKDKVSAEFEHDHLGVEHKSLTHLFSKLSCKSFDSKGNPIEVPSYIEQYAGKPPEPYEVDPSKKEVKEECFLELSQEEKDYAPRLQRSKTIKRSQRLEPPTSGIRSRARRKKGSKDSKKKVDVSGQNK